MSDESAISLEMGDSDSELGSPSGWLQTHRGHDELSRITRKRKAGEKLLRGSPCFRLLEELVTTERNFVMQLQACAESYEKPMRQSHLLHSASPGLVDLLFADLRDVRRLHIGFLNELEEIWDDEFSRLDNNALRQPDQLDHGSGGSNSRRGRPSQVTRVASTARCGRREGGVAVKSSCGG